MSTKSSSKVSREDVENPAQVAKIIRDSLIELYKKRSKFTDDEELKDASLWSTTHGLISLLSLALGFQKSFTKAEVTDVLQKATLQMLDFVDEFGYLPHGNIHLMQAFPPSDDEDIPPREVPRYSTEAAALILRTIILLKAAEENSFLNFGTTQKAQELQARLKAIALEALGKLLDSACENGGWGFSSDSPEGHLYETSVVSETFADYDWYVVGESDKRLKLVGSPVMQEWFGPLDERIREVRHKALRYVGDKYIGLSGTPEGRRNSMMTLGIQPILEETDFGRAEREELESKRQSLLNPPFYDGPANSFRALYYGYYALSVILLNDAEDLGFDKGDQARFEEAAERALYLSRIQFDLAQSYEVEPGRAWMDDAEQSTMRRKISMPGRPDINLKDPTLLPLAVRCNILYAWYYANGADQKIKSLVARFLKDRKKKNGLWDQTAFNLVITKRAVDALVDYKDYFDTYASPSVAEASATSADSVTTLDDLLKLQMQSYLQSDEGKKLIREAAPVPPAPQAQPVVAAKGDFDISQLVTFIQHVRGVLLGTKDDPDGSLSAIIGELEEFLLLLVIYSSMVQDLPSQGLSDKDSKTIKEIEPRMRKDLRDALHWILESHTEYKDKSNRRLYDLIDKVSEDMQKIS